jgi:hypothetical protein
MGHPGDVAIDARGQVWVAETTLLPKRVSVWTREGALVREFVGTPFYGGGGSLLGDFAYYSGMRFRWNEDRSEAELDAILFDPDAHPELPMKPALSVHRANLARTDLPPRGLPGLQQVHLRRRNRRRRAPPPASNTASTPQAASSFGRMG